MTGDECLNVEWFRNQREAQVGIEIWRRHYNDVRPHRSLQYHTPAEFKAGLALQIEQPGEESRGAVLQ